MKSTISILALSALFALVSLNGPTASAQSGEAKANTQSSQSKKSEDRKNSKKDNKKTKKKKDVVVKVKAGDTLSSIAKKYDLTYVELYNANKNIADPDMIDIGDKIRIPKKGEKLPDRFSKHQAELVAAASVVTQTTQAIYQPATNNYVSQTYTTAPVNSSSYYVGNGMWCTDYVHSKRPDVPIYSDAGMHWISAAQAEGKSTGSTPRAGAVAVMNGHVAYVEKVNSDGSYVVSEMGWNYQPGNFNRRTVQPGAFGGFIY